MDILMISIGIAVVFILLVWWFGASNSFKRKTVKIGEALSGIEVALTKRCDMLTKLLDVSKGFAAHENELFQQVIALRHGMAVGELNEVSGRLDTLEARVFAVAESYPELRSADVFRELQTGIRDAEEHVQAARRLYNSSVAAFNTAIAMFPSSIVAKSQRLEKKEFFAANKAKCADIEMKF